MRLRPLPSQGISMHRLYSLIPNRFPTKRPTSLIEQDANAIFVIGGNKAVSHNVENEIRATHPSATITRLAGSTRFDTAHSIYNELATLGAKPRTATISTGFNFANALSISPYSYMQSAPVFLSSKSELDEASPQYAQKLPNCNHRWRQTSSPNICRTAA